MSAPARDSALAARIAASAGLRVGAGGGSVRPLTGGNQNHVFRVRGPGTDAVVRFARDDARWDCDPFDVEAWCLPTARAAGIPTAPLLARGRLEGVSYLVLGYVPGATRTRGSVEEWHLLGTFARRAAQVLPDDDAPDGLFGRFGRDLPLAWQRHLQFNLDALGPSDPLLAAGVYAADDAGSVARILEMLRAVPFDHGLAHGDLSPRNLVVPDLGAAVLIDWGAASAGPAPWTDLLVVRRWWLGQDPQTPVTDDDLEAFAQGCGIDLVAEAPTIDALELVHALDVVRWALDRRPDRFPELRGAARLTVRRALDAARPS